MKTDAFHLTQTSVAILALASLMFLSVVRLRPAGCFELIYGLVQRNIAPPTRRTAYVPNTRRNGIDMRLWLVLDR